MKRTHPFLTAVAAFAFLGTAAFGQAVTGGTAAPGAVTPSQAAGTTGTGSAPRTPALAPDPATENRGEAITGRTATGGSTGLPDNTTGTTQPRVETARPVIPPATVPSRVVPSAPPSTPVPRATTPGAATPVPKSDRPGGLDVGVPDAATGGKVLDITQRTAVPPPVTTPGTATTGGATTK